MFTSENITQADDPPSTHSKFFRFLDISFNDHQICDNPHHHTPDANELYSINKKLRPDSNPKVGIFDTIIAYQINILEYYMTINTFVYTKLPTMFQNEIKLDQNLRPSKRRYDAHIALLKRYQKSILKLSDSDKLYNVSRLISRKLFKEDLKQIINQIEHFTSSKQEILAITFKFFFVSNFGLFQLQELSKFIDQDTLPGIIDNEIKLWGLISEFDQSLMAFNASKYIIDFYIDMVDMYKAEYSYDQPVFELAFQKILLLPLEAYYDENKASNKNQFFEQVKSENGGLPSDPSNKLLLQFLEEFTNHLQFIDPFVQLLKSFDSIFRSKLSWSSVKLPKKLDIDECMVGNAIMNMLKRNTSDFMQNSREMTLVALSQLCNLMLEYCEAHNDIIPFTTAKFQGELEFLSRLEELSQDLGRLLIFIEDEMNNDLKLIMTIEHSQFRTLNEMFKSKLLKLMTYESVIQIDKKLEKTYWTYTA